MMRKLGCITIMVGLLLCSCAKQYNDVISYEDAQGLSASETMSETQESGETLEPPLFQDNPPMSVMQTFRSVLLNETAIFYTNKVLYKDLNVVLQDSVALSELSDESNPPKIFCQFAVVDMDGDTTPEVVLAIEEYRGFVILRYQEGQIYGYDVPYRALMALRENGAFISSQGAFDNQMEKMYFIGDTYVGDQKAHYEDSYFINGILVDKDDYDEVDALFKETPEAQWHDYTEEAVNEFIVESPLFAESPAEMDESIEERQAYLDSLTYLIELTYGSSNKNLEEYKTYAQSYYGGCYEEMEKIYHLCQEKLTGAALANLETEQQRWEKSNANELKKLYEVNDIEELDERHLYLYYKYGDIALRRTLRLINLYYDFPFYDWVK